MATQGHLTRLLISMLLFMTVFVVVLWPAANDPALVVAARDNDVDAVRMLLGKHVTVNDSARDGSTALLWAVHLSFLGIVRARIVASSYIRRSSRVKASQPAVAR